MLSEAERREMRHTGEVAALEREAMQFLAGLFGVFHHFVHNIRSAFRIRMDSLANLAAENISGAPYLWHCRFFWRLLRTG